MARSPPVSTRLDTAHAALTRTARVVSFRQRISAGVAIAANVVVWGKRTRRQVQQGGRETRAWSTLVRKKPDTHSTQPTFHAWNVAKAPRMRHAAARTVAVLSLHAAANTRSQRCCWSS